MKAIKISLFILLASYSTYAQTGVSIPANADIMAHKTDTIAIFSDVQNHGRFGSIKGAVVLFFGQKWKNDETALLTDEHFYNDTVPGYGGTFRFMQQGATPQYIYGAYNAGTHSGPSFPNISINNPNGVYLDDLSDLKIRNNLHFENGHLYLNGWNLVVGNLSPGIISGYSDRRFIVTGSNVGGGFLYREHVTPQDKQVVFPIGTTAGSYSPLAVQNLEFTSEDFRARVFDNVYRNATSGNVISGNNVLKTWNVGHNASTGSSSYFVWLQHDAKDESPAFSLLREFSYISLYRTNGGWDTIPPGTVENPGKLTNGPLSISSYTNTRTFPGGLGNNVYFSKSAALIPRAISSLGFNAYRISLRMVETNWAASREVNILQYELQRRRENEDSFYTVKVVPPKTPRSTVNQNVQYYTVPDDNFYDNWTYYRLKILGLDGLVAYSEIRKVPWFYEIKVSPNPSNGIFYVSLYGLPKPVRMEMYDMAGRLHNTRILTDTNTRIQMSRLSAGTYVLVFYDMEDKGKLLDRKQLIILK
ncbi:T9SS type A sorting domain-containing protein [Chitinophaga sp. SYP-B3965]|uniref:T9SS type A sorting domain-containing protein n=1 Tax=Chitinophaga sp. SYP-B3965 TaxID=2663120 RepID=UPI0015636202|nr:T9SS type A sorting domain-containing protein [Chitinophaga sp. SYP-B3965]